MNLENGKVNFFFIGKTLEKNILKQSTHIGF